MFVETVRHKIRLVKPRSFAGLMALYESNHARMRQLLGNVSALPQRSVSSSETDLNLHVTRVERCRYTTSLHMTYHFESTDSLQCDPDLLLRVYHDARLAEALSCCDSPRHEALRGLILPTTSELERRWSLNIMLNKWLEYCLDHRHRFRTV
ncbi:MAG TPA: DUF1249 domain-containing protein [Gammaproteobacteria bacterium]|jgi:uncharacterized protein YqiB (DUF1249 family)|nr:DUF1249 domain-containing protein [Gammaproteobacteria bacterium]